MKNIITFFFCISIGISHLLAQNKYFEHFYNLSDVIEFQKIIPTVDSNYLCMGNYINYNIGKSNPFLTKINVYGDTIWHKSYTDGNKEFIFRDIVTTNNGYALAVNVSDTYIQDSSDASVWFIGTAGQILGQRSLKDNNFDSYNWSIDNTLDGGYLLSGCIVNYDYEWRATKVDALGNIEWDSIYVLPVHSNQIHDVIVAPDGNGYYLCGFVAWDWYAFPYRQADMALMKIDLNGVPQWYKQYDPAEDDKAFCAIQTHNGDIILGGVISPEQVNRGYLFKVDSLGNEANGWQKIYLEDQKCSLLQIVELPDHSLVSMGNTTDLLNSPPMLYDFEGYIQKTDSVGGLLWRRIYGGIYHDYFYGMLALPNNNGYMLVGRRDTIEDNTGKARAWLVKTNCMGLLTEPIAHFTRTQVDLSATFQNLSQYVYPDSIDGGHFIWDFGDGTTSTEINPTHTYAVAGEYSVTLTAMVCSDTSSYTEVVGVWATGVEEAIAQQNLVEISPNPANTYLNIKTLQAMQCQFVLYNMLGQAVLRIPILLGQKQIKLTDLPNGTYFYQIIEPLSKQSLQHGKVSIIH